MLEPRGSAINSFFKNIQIFLGGRFIFAATTFAIGVITARLLAPENRGLYTLFFTLSGLLVTLLHVGVSPANVYFLNEKKIEIGELIGNTFTYILISLCLLGGVFFVFVFFEFRGPFTNVSSGIIWFLLWLTVLYTLIETSISGLVYASNLYLFLSRSLIYQSIVLFLATSLILVVGPHIEQVIGLRVFAICIFIFWFLFAFLKIVNFKRLSVSFLTLKDQIKFGSKNWAQNIIGFLNVRSFLFLLVYYGNPEAVGFFSVAWMLVEVIRFIPDTVGTMLLPELTNDKSKSEQVILIIRSLKIILFGVLFLSVILFFSLDIIFPLLFGIAYIPSINIAKLLLAGSIFGVVYQVMTRYFTSQAKQRYSLVSGLCGLLAGLIASIVLIPIYTGKGAAIAFSISALITAAFSLYYFCKLTNTSFRELVNISYKDFLIR